MNGRGLEGLPTLRATCVAPPLARCALGAPYDAVHEQAEPAQPGAAAYPFNRS
jgi:hypothetical protein